MAHTIHRWASVVTIATAFVVLGPWDPARLAAQGSAREEAFTMVTLAPVPGGSLSEASGMNNRGQIVGRSRVEGTEFHAMFWEDGTPTDLGTLDGGNLSHATAINKSGDLVGYSNTASLDFHAVLWGGRLPCRPRDVRRIRRLRLWDQRPRADRGLQDGHGIRGRSRGPHCVTLPLASVACIPLTRVFNDNAVQSRPVLHS